MSITLQRKFILRPAPTSLAPKALSLDFVTSSPVPTLQTPTSVLISLKALALSSRELQILQGTYTAPHALADNLVPAGAGAGEIVKIGPAVKGWTVGDRVIPSGMGGHHHTTDLEMSSLERSLGAARDGCAQEYLVMDQEDLLPVASHLTWEEAACMPAAATAWACLFGHTPCLLPGSTVLTIGTGGVSLFAAQFALASGSRVIMLSSADEKIDKSRQLLKPWSASASKDSIRFINYTTCPEWDQEVKSMTSGRGADCVVEVGGWGTIGKSVRSVRRGGLVALTGYLTKYREISDDIIRQDLSQFILFSAASVRGIFTGNRTQVEQMMRFVDTTGIRPVFPFEQLPMAYEEMRSSKDLGKIVVRIQ